MSTSSFESDEVYSVLQAFQPFLKSIDMRTLAVRPQPGEDWLNLITSMIVSTKTVDEISNAYANLPKLKTNQIQVFFSAVRFDLEVFEGFVQGDIGTKWGSVSKAGYAEGSRHIKMRQFNPLELKMVSHQWKTEGLKWVLSAAGSNTSPDRAQLWDIVQSQSRVAKSHGYRNIEDLIMDTLRIENVLHDVDFRLSIFDLAKIRNVNFGDSSFEVEIEKVKGLRDLQLNVKVDRTTNGGVSSTILKKPFPLDDCEEEASGELCLLKKTVQPPTLFQFDNIEIELFHRNSVLTLDQIWLKAPLRNVVEPFYDVLTAFCPLDKFSSMLLKPEDFENAPDKIFENAVSWLLSLAGFYTIYLAANSRDIKMNFDKLKKYDKYHVGSADIIAYEDNERVLLVDCDISGIDETKIRKLEELSEYFEDLSKYEELEFIPVLFTPRYIGEDMRKRHLAIVDGNIIEIMLEDLAKGDRKQARMRIRNLKWDSL